MKVQNQLPSKRRALSRQALLGIFFLLPVPGLLARQGVGTICSFRAEDPDSASFTHENLRGRVTILFYETRAGADGSRALKDRMNLSYAGQPDDIRRAMQRIAIVDGKEAPRLLRPFWRDAIRKRAVTEGIPIYIDWDGSVGSACSLNRQSGTTVALFDQRGRLRMMFDGATASADQIVGEIARLIVEGK